MRRLIAVPLVLAGAGVALVIGLYRQAVVNLDRQTIQSHSRLYRQLLDTQSQRLEALVAATTDETRRWAAVLGGKGPVETYLRQIVTLSGEYPVRYLDTAMVFRDPPEGSSFLNGVPLDRFPDLGGRVREVLASGRTQILNGIPWNRDGRGLLIVSPVGGLGENARGALVREIPWDSLSARFFGTAEGGADTWYAVVAAGGGMIEPPPGVGGPDPLLSSEIVRMAAEAPVARTTRGKVEQLVVFGRPAGWLRETAGVAIVRIPVRVEVGINPQTYVSNGARVAEMIGELFPLSPPSGTELAGRLPEIRAKLPFPVADVELLAEPGGERLLAAVRSTGHPESRLTEWRPAPGEPAISVVEVVAPYRAASGAWVVGIVQPLSTLLAPTHAGMRQSLLVAFGIMLVLVTMGLVMTGAQRAFYRRRVEEAEARLHLEAEVRRAKTELQEIVDGIDTGILLVDAGGTVQRVNNALALRVGASPGGLIGARAADLLPPWVPWPFPGPAGAVPLSGPWGERRVEVSFYPVGIREGAGPQTVVTVQDVTERLAVEERLRVAEKLAATSTLVAGVAHEIKNPLNSMSLSLGNLSFILGKHGDESLRAKGAGYVDRLREDIRRLTLLVNRFMEVARPVSEERRPVDLAGIGRAVAARFAEQARLQGIEVRVEGDEVVPELLLEPVETERAVENLVVNAIEAMPDGGVLTVRTWVGEGEVVLEIGDTGPGVPPEIGGRIFDIFFTTKEEGTGLGLSIVYRAIEGQGGRIELRSESGRGARFRITFPLP